MLSEKDRAFLARRRVAVRVLPAVGISCVLAWLGLWAYFLTTRPLLTNPLYFMAHAATLTDDVLTSLAALAPLAVSGLFLAVLAFLLIALGLVLDQRRLVRLLDVATAAASERKSSKE